MAELSTSLTPFAESLIEPGETLLGACVATRQTAFKGWMLVIAVTEGRLVLQKMKRSKSFEADGPPLALRGQDVAAAKVAGAGNEFLSPTVAIFDAASVRLKLKTTAGEKIKLTISRGGDSFFGKLGGGEVQREGLLAIGRWFERQGRPDPTS
jgi:hypothetical protein